MDVYENFSRRVFKGREGGREGWVGLLGWVGLGWGIGFWVGDGDGDGDGGGIVRGLN